MAGQDGARGPGSAGGGGIATQVLRADRDGIARAALLLRAGKLVAFPTETVYGIGADSTDPEATAAIYAAKRRPAKNPLISHVPTPDAAWEWCEAPGPARALAAAFWPGPLTLVLPLKPGRALAAADTPEGPKAAIRCPAHKLARALLEAVGRPVAAPSANLSGQVSPTMADHVLEGLGGRIDAVLDGGACKVGVESTILAPRADGTARLLRQGGVPVEALREMLGDKLRDASGAPLGDGPAAPAPEPAAPEAPGMLSSHYAPGAAVRLNAEAPRKGEAWLGFGPDPASLEEAVRADGDGEGAEMLDFSGPRMNLSKTGDVEEAAANLFAALRALDARLGGKGCIAVAPVPETGLGAAVNDRLRRAAAPRG